MLFRVQIPPDPSQTRPAHCCKVISGVKPLVHTDQVIAGAVKAPANAAVSTTKSTIERERDRERVRKKVQETERDREKQRERQGETERETGIQIQRERETYGARGR